MKETETKGEEEKIGPGGCDQVGRLRERDGQGAIHVVEHTSNAHMAALICHSFLQGYGKH